MNITAAVDTISSVVKHAEGFRSQAETISHLMTCLYCHTRIIAVWEDDTIGNACPRCGGVMKQAAICSQCLTKYEFGPMSEAQIKAALNNSAEEKHQHELVIDDTGATGCETCDAVFEYVRGRLTEVQEEITPHVYGDNEQYSVHHKAVERKKHY
jgi:uncharacterized protein with PIN domain